MKSQEKDSNSFEVVPIDDQHQQQQHRVTLPTHHEAPRPEQAPSPTQRRCISPRGRLVFLAAYLLISGISSLYFCLVEASTDSLELCDSVASCMLFATQGWPALGGNSVDLVVMSYISGIVSLLGAILGAYGLLAAYKESSSKVRLFARIWWIMIVIMIACTIVSLLLTIVHKQRFLNECVMGQGVGSSADKCSSMYASALVGSMLGCLIGMTMIWCYGEDVITYSIQLETVKEKTRRIEDAS